MRCFYKILLLIQSQILYFSCFLFLSIDQSFISFHSTNSTDFLISFDPLLLEFLNRFLQFYSYFFIAFSQFNDSCKTVFSFYSEFAKIVIENIKLWIVRNIRAGDLKFIFFVLIERDETTTLSLSFHLFKDFDEGFELLL